MVERPNASDAVGVQHPALGVVVVAVRGEVDLVSIGGLEQVIAEQVRRQPTGSSST
ncbi:hypothetical protein GCM10023321_72710 [Pseudonocardia eucalypti]|uniref:STAS domain-containing protein n=1 Tax=Pseudonocardia eucalypti TaxID=648755 RepID=A0ABP9R7P0_9PSEU|nr:hypothetical protein [Pseudonocardia eucalypti]